MKNKKLNNKIGFRYAWNGLIYLVVHEKNFRIHIIATILVITLSFIFQLNRMECAVILLIIGMVLLAEIFNSVLEELLDFIEPAYHERVKIMKDMMAAAVLVLAFLSVVIGLLIFLPKILSG